ncbi:MAG: hypothetical protein R3F11_08445 [Verrucomicrobiales bacterium]
MPEEENAFALLEEAAALARMTESDDPEGVSAFAEIEESDEYGSGIAAEFLAGKREALEALDAALERPSFRVPRVEFISDEVPANYNGILDLVKILRVGALHKAANGDRAGAVSDVKKMAAVCDWLQNGEGSLIHSLAAVTAATNVVTCVEMLADELGEEDALIAADLQRTLPKLETCREAIEFSLRVEYLIQKIMVEQVLKGEFTVDHRLQGKGHGKRPSPLVFKPNETLQRFADFDRGAIEDLGRFASEREVGRYAFEEPSYPERFISGNPVGILLFSITMPNYEVILQRVLAEMVRTQLVILKLALRRHEFAHGSLPDSLDALVPEFLDAVPADPYDGKPLRYSKENRIVYSVGKDLVDGGGSPEEEFDIAAPDPTVKLAGYVEGVEEE